MKAVCVGCGGCRQKFGRPCGDDKDNDVDDNDDDDNDGDDDDDDVVGSEEGRVDICSPEWFHGFMARYIARRVTS